MGTEEEDTWTSLILEAIISLSLSLLVFELTPFFVSTPITLITTIFQLVIIGSILIIIFVFLTPLNKACLKSVFSDPLKREIGGTQHKQDDPMGGEEDKYAPAYIRKTFGAICALLMLNAITVLPVYLWCGSTRFEDVDRHGFLWYGWGFIAVVVERLDVACLIVSLLFLGAVLIATTYDMASSITDIIYMHGSGYINFMIHQNDFGNHKVKYEEKKRKKKLSMPLPSQDPKCLCTKCLCHQDS